METIHQFMHILIPLLPQHGTLDVFLLIYPHRVILFLDVVSEWILRGCGREKIGFPLVPFLTAWFPRLFDMGGGFEKCKNNIFSVREIMDWEISFEKIQPSIYDVYIYLAFKYMNVEFDLYLKRSGTSKVATGCRYVAYLQLLKDLGKVIHPCVPLFLKGLL